MATLQGHTTTNQSAELMAASLLLSKALQMASTSYNSSSPDRGRGAIRIALVAVINLISELYPNEPSFPLPLNELLHGLADLDRGKVVPLLKPVKISNSPGNSLSEELFRAFPAAAMTRLVDDRVLSRDKAARDIARRLSKMRCKHSSGASIAAAQVTKWREKMMTERASENLAVARYHSALQWVSGREAVAAVEFLLDALPDLSPSNFPKKPQA